MRKYRPIYKPRSVKNLERKTRNRLILSLVLIVGVFYFFISIGLPLLIGGLTKLTKPKTTVIRTSATEDPAIAPPVLNIPFESTNSAQFVITGFSSPGNKVELYLDDDLKTTSPTNSDGSFTSDPISLSVGNNNIYGKSINDDKKSLASKTIKLIYSDEKPKLEVTEPQDNQQIKGGDKKIKVSGKTDPSSTIMVNSLTTIVNNDGNFSTDVPLNDGDNTLQIIAQNTVGNSTKIERKVNYTPE